MSEAWKCKLNGFHFLSHYIRGVIHNHIQLIERLQEFHKFKIHYMKQKEQTRSNGQKFKDAKKELLFQRRKWAEKLT